MRLVLLAPIVVVAGCVDTKTTSPVAPRILFPLEDATPTYAYVPGTRLDMPVSWAALCTTDGVLPDTSTTRTCDEQDFVARVTCAGAPCEIDPPEASTGIALNGSGSITIVAPTPGDLAIEVTLEHADTHEQLVKRGQLAVRALEHVVIDCVYQAYDPAMPRCEQKPGYVLCTDVAWVACPTQGTVDPTWSTPVSIWIYGEGAGYPIAPSMVVPGLDNSQQPRVTFTGFAPTRTDYFQRTGHRDVRASAVAQMYLPYLKTAGDFTMHADVAGLSADVTMSLALP